MNFHQLMYAAVDPEYDVLPKDSSAPRYAFLLDCIRFPFLIKAFLEQNFAFLVKIYELKFFRLFKIDNVSRLNLPRLHLNLKERSLRRGNRRKILHATVFSVLGSMRKGFLLFIANF